jgi:2-phospho-L-lactate guanylyltransferase
VVPTAVVIPLRGFDGKARLDGVLDQNQRRDLIQRLATGVVHAALTRDRVLIVSSDPEVGDWAEGLGAVVVEDPGTGLDDAAGAGVTAATDRGATHVMVAHADLARPGPLAHLHVTDGILLVPDRRLDGTNVIGIPVDLPFRFCYGPGSFQRHLAEAQRHGVEPTILKDPDLGWDVDLPEDLEGLC